ncbi:hypothetical protein KAR91_43905 [Candidatus Pacearchaeota archaeon]|nr:hypothetical protein [Candidatus Pacearchaeota archaeon]
MKIPIDKRIDRLTNWYRRENDRPLLGFYLDSQYPLHRFRGSNIHIPSGHINPDDIVVADYLDDCDRLYELYEKAGGDLIWSASPFFGLPWIEAALGCNVIANQNTGSTHTEPPVDFKNNPIIPQFSEDNPWVAKMLEFIPAMQQRSVGRYPIGVTLMRGISDLLSALYGGEQFILQMYDNPDRVMSVAEQLTDFWIKFGKCMLDHLTLFKGGTGVFFYSTWCPGKTIWTQEDSAALLSPQLYEQFIFPQVCKIAEAFDNIVIHLHPANFIPVDYLLKSQTNVIELHIDKGGFTAQDLHEYHRKIIAKKPLIIWGDLTENDLEFVLKNLPYKGLAINMVVSDENQASDVWEKAARLWNERK